MDIKKEAMDLKDQIIKWRRDLHQIPETGMNLPQTSGYVKKRLEEMGISYQTFPDHSGIVCLLGKPGGRTVALRADMDGLPIREENQCDYAATNGCMHACGHDGHTAALLGAARILKAHENELNGYVKLIFQPDEENIAGGPKMVADGVLKNPDVDGFYAMHVGGIAGEHDGNGDILVSRGGLFATSGGFRIVFKGKGAHSSTPQLSKDPILAAAHFIEAIQGLISREVSPWDAATLTVSYIEAGNNSTYGLIPETARLHGGLRTVTYEVYKHLMERITEIANFTAASMGMSADIEYVSPCLPVVNDKQMVEDFLVSAGKVVPSEKIVMMDHGTLGGEDAGAYMAEVPGCYFLLYNLVASDDGVVYPHHNSRFSIDDSCLYEGSALLAQAAVDFLAK